MSWLLRMRSQLGAITSPECNGATGTTCITSVRRFWHGRDCRRSPSAAVWREMGPRCWLSNNHLALTLRGIHSMLGRREEAILDADPASTARVSDLDNG